MGGHVLVSWLSRRGWREARPQEIHTPDQMPFRQECHLHNRRLEARDQRHDGPNRHIALHRLVDLCLERSRCCKRDQVSVNYIYVYIQCQVRGVLSANIEDCCINTLRDVSIGIYDFVEINADGPRFQQRVGQRRNVIMIGGIKQGCPARYDLIVDDQ